MRSEGLTRGLARRCSRAVFRVGIFAGDDAAEPEGPGALPNRLVREARRETGWRKSLAKSVSQCVSPQPDGAGRHDQPVKRRDDCQIALPSQLCVLTSVVAVTCLTPPGAVTSTTTRKSRCRSLNPAMRRSGVSLTTGNIPIMSLGAGKACARRFQAQRRHQEIAQRQQRFGPSRLPRHHALGHASCIEVAIADFNSERRRRTARRTAAHRHRQRGQFRGLSSECKACSRVSGSTRAEEWHAPNTCRTAGSGLPVRFQKSDKTAKEKLPWAVFPT